MSSTPEGPSAEGAWRELLVKIREDLPQAGVRLRRQLRHPDSNTLVAALALVALLVISVFTIPLWATGPILFGILLALRSQHHRSLHGSDSDRGQPHQSTLGRAPSNGSPATINAEHQP